MMSINKKFKLANISFLVAAVLFLAITIVFGMKAFEPQQEPTVKKYREKTYVSYTINDETADGYLTNEQVQEIEVKIEYFNDNSSTRGTIDARKVAYIKTKDFAGNTVHGVFGDIEIVESKKTITADKTVITFTIDYQAYQTNLSNYIATLDPESKYGGKLDLCLSATNKAGAKKDAVVSISLLEDVVTINTTKSIDSNETITIGEPVEDNKMLVILTLGCGFLVVCFIGCFLVSYKLSKMDDYKRKVLVIFKLNKGILVESDLTSVEDGFVVASFNELLKVQNSVSLPILYTKGEDKIRFVIKAGSSVYSYTIAK